MAFRGGQEVSGGRWRTWATREPARLSPAGSLSALVSQHSISPLSLPCCLRIPSKGGCLGICPPPSPLPLRPKAQSPVLAPCLPACIGHMNLGLTTPALIIISHLSSFISSVPSILPSDQHLLSFQFILCSDPTLIIPHFTSYDLLLLLTLDCPLFHLFVITSLIIHHYYLPPFSFHCLNLL